MQPGARPLAAANFNELSIYRDDSLAEISTDSTKLRQCLLNLLSNAAKFTRNGQIALTVRRERNPGGDWISLQVSDTGIGIAKAAIDRLFTDFEQATSAIKGDFGGTGLGLAISQRLCALMGGSISVESELGRGSVFTIRIPAELHLEAAPPAATEQRLVA